DQELHLHIDPPFVLAQPLFEGHVLEARAVRLLRHAEILPLNVSHAAGSPLCCPTVNQCFRSADDPCVQVSGFTGPCVSDWIRSSPTAAAASSASATSACVRSIR